MFWGKQFKGSSKITLPNFQFKWVPKCRNADFGGNNTIKDNYSNDSSIIAEI